MRVDLPRYISFPGIVLLVSTGILLSGRGPGIVPPAPTAMAADAPLKAGMIDPKTGKKIKYWVAPMDPTYIRDEPGKSPMGMDLVPKYEEADEEKEPASTIRIDPVTIQNMGVRYGNVVRKPLTRSIRTYGNITYDETRRYVVNIKFNGWIEKLFVDFVGETVRKGAPLFKIYSPDLISAQQEYLLAAQQMRRLPQTAVLSPARRDAQRLFDAARTRLEYWDLTADQIEAIARKGAVFKTLTIYSPAAGVVTRKEAYEGHYVTAGAHQFEIADLSTVWVDVDIYEYELPWVRKGMPARMELPYQPGKAFNGQVLFIYPYLDAQSRTARLRLAFDNQDGRLKPGMYANVYLQSQLPGDTLVIPQEAVIDSGVRRIVFLARDKGKFQPREVDLGVEGDDYEVQVLDGLQEGDKIVVSGQFMLDSESRLREAIQKMMAAKNTPAPADDLDMEDMTMDEDMDMTDMDMGDMDMGDTPGADQ